ncbi:M24 family metallopeptidase [Mycobacterium xenopi]|uniref:Peptidase M24 n=2 Tax=Mycobacterium xenopi TaxID=1789 RepID=A0AAD1M1B0_MYCXE|nr:M24 family metallopeptidase [Mycobacterium xenopi]EUA65725.1 metallopeptidase M24 family protein [Mycobacterium xenopi 4042]MDA3641160.1 M24 family metallopeptidase [Mycobacterium xenopi]MDA3658960.1 M24 family metallopeptidase [Mycobacterium xenopi]MDA3663005.1 M24 family metallopeptidase [Mycobacterium xenopi]ORX19614.1 Xaa-Pro aminopeptidase [Mycobacterium xenopi]
MSPVPRDRGVLIGAMGLEDDARVNFARLRAQRRAKVFSGMETHHIDALLLGSVGNVRYVSGARLLGRFGVLPFAPLAVVVAETARVHVLSTWDEGVPPEIGRDQLYGMSWNPVNLMEALAAIPGLRQARRVGTDGLTPMIAGLVSQLVTAAELVDAAPVMAAARRTKTPDEITCLQVASAIAEAALTAMDEVLAPGITERELLGVYYERVSRLGAPYPPSESVCFATPASGPVRYRHLVSDRPVGQGELVVLAPGALYAGYEAGLARTRPVGESAPPGSGKLASRCARGMDALLAACRAGNTGADLYRAWQDAGNRDSPLPLAHGLGLGAEPPLVGLGRGSAAMLEEGMVLCVQSWVAEEGIGGCLERATVLVENRQSSTLTRYGRLK